MPLKFNETERHVLMTKAGISRQLIAAWETGVCNPNKENAVVVADFTGRDLVDILYGRNPGEKNGKAASA